MANHTPVCKAMWSILTSI
ncbi:hypothetical protein F383_20045 [Gossypium arboreum]|uniref:Uncharacterized protein n=1 Tax=Gossypium arboreum TaxID=29729 RepID=A0A0B0NHU2_GOSAR|nr:hypothetical protein F383_17457 [Gossypium arboreum]KHG15161.1 hypothetical protein F383_20045 [Gossypium arboreum]